MNIRNLAIIAHVDHGKTTLVDHLLKKSGVFAAHQEVEDRHMDSMDLERERGITIAAKNASYVYKDVKVNIVDTPGHSDFGGEVERILDMVDGALLLVDASEGPLPQTRFVLQKALEKNLKIIVVINKIDRPDARVSEVHDEVFDLFIDVGATDEQADFETIYTIAKEGIATLDDKKPTGDFTLLLDWINEKVPAPPVETAGSFQMLVSNIGYNNFVGRLAIGRVRRGSIKVGDELLLTQPKGNLNFKVSALFTYRGSEQVQADKMSAGDIAIVAGMTDLFIGDTITNREKPDPLPRIKVEPPTVGIFMSVNDGPFAGREGKKLTSRQIKERLEKELLYNVAITVESTDAPDTFKVSGRGELQLAVLIEQMRREGFELLVSKPQVIFQTDESGQKMEPMETVVVDVDDQYSGVVTQKLGERKGVLMAMNNREGSRTRLEFLIPSRGLIGYRSEFLTDTRGTGLLNTQFAGYEPYKGPIPTRKTGALVSDRQGKATGYALFNLEDRGRLFITPGVDVYSGLIAGETNKGIDLEVNLTREKKLSNVRASGSDEAIKLTPVKAKTLEEAMEWISEAELVEVTPENIRIRSRYLDSNERQRMIKKMKDQ